MKFVNWQWLIALLSLFVVDLALASKPLDFSIHQSYVSARALGMGNAFSAVADDHTALFFNPASLARMKESQLRMVLGAGLSTEYSSLVRDIENLKSTGNSTESITQLLQSNYGKYYYSRLPKLEAAWVQPGWGIAFIPSDLSLDIGIHQEIGPSLNVNAYLDSTIAYGMAWNYSFGVEEHLLSFGFAAKVLHRVYGGTIISSALLANGVRTFEQKRADEGMTIDVDVGLLFTPKWDTWFFKALKPSHSLVIRNLADYGFPIDVNLLSSNSQRPPKAQRRIDVGTKIEVPNFWVFDPYVAIDIRDILHENWTFEKGLHIGAELYWKMYRWWKGHWSVGLNQMYWTAGVGARLTWFRIDLATYGEEVGTSNATKESRRYMLELSMDF